MESVDPASVNSCTGCADSAAQYVCQFFQDTAVNKRFSAVHAAAAGNDSVSFFDLNAFAAHFNEFNEFRHEVSVGKFCFHFDNFACSARISFRFFEYVRTNSTHLRTVIRANDFSHDVAAQSRTSPNDRLAVFVNGKTRAVSRQARFQGVSDAGAEIAADVRSAYEEYVRFNFMEEVAQNFRVSRCVVVSQFFIVIYIYFVSAMSDEFLCQRFYVITNQYRTYFVTDAVSQFTALAQQFERYVT